jgi:hypothetical protein
MTIAGQEYKMTTGIDLGSHYLTVEKDISGETVEIRLQTTIRQIFYTIQVQKEGSENIFESDILSLVFFILLLFLLSKYVLFYKIKKIDD